MTSPPDGVLLGVDVGGTSMSAGLVMPDGQVLVTRGRSTHGPDGGDAIERIFALTAEVAALPDARAYHLLGVGAGLPGLVDVASGTVGGEAHHVPELTGVPANALYKALTE